LDCIYTSWEATWKCGCIGGSRKIEDIEVGKGVIFSAL
jgi:hypothetical protein